MTDYEKVAKQGVEDVISEIRPQAERDDDEKTLELIETVESHLENENTMRMVMKLRKLKNRAKKKGYKLDI